MGAARPPAVASQPTVDNVDEQPVNTPVPRHLRMKRRSQHRTLPHRNGVAGRPGQHLNTRTDPLHPGRADEDRVHRLIEPGERDVAFE